MSGLYESAVVSRTWDWMNKILHERSCAFMSPCAPDFEGDENLDYESWLEKYESRCRALNNEMFQFWSRSDFEATLTKGKWTYKETPLGELELEEEGWFIVSPEIGVRDEELLEEVSLLSVAFKQEGFLFSEPTSNGIRVESWFDPKNPMARFTFATPYHETGL